MFKNYLKIAFRNLNRYRLFSSVNIIGLAVAMASFIIILVYFNYELNYDKWDDSLKKVYKISLQKDGEILPTTQAPLASLLKQDYPNVEAATAIIPNGDFEVLLSANGKSIYQKGIVTVDSNFLKVFPYKIIEGDVKNALEAPNAVVLSKELSNKLFGMANPIGKPIKIYNAIDAMVTAVMEKPSGPSQLDAQMLMRDPYGKQNMFWENYSFETYIKLKQPIAEAQLENYINKIFYNSQLKKDNLSYEEFIKKPVRTNLFTDALQDLHNFPKHGQSHFKITIVLLILALFLLIAGAINFSNLSIARAITRAKEVGLRKVLGSKRIQIIFQSLVEIALQCFIGLIIAIILINTILPYFNNAFNLSLSFFNHRNTFSITWQITASICFIIIVGGLYPSLFLSHFKSAEVLNGKYTKGEKGIFFRNSLLVVQLSLSALFITAMIVINKQMDFMKTKDLGFNPTQVLRIEATQQSREDGFAHIKELLMGIPGVEYVTKTTVVPGGKLIDTSNWKYTFAGKEVRLNAVRVDVDYFKAINASLVQGRLFDKNRGEDLNNGAIINEAAAQKLGVLNLVGQRLNYGQNDSLPYSIIGVVKDFNVAGLQSQVTPTIYSIGNGNNRGYKSGGAILVKIKTDQPQQTLAGIESEWKKIEPDMPIRYSFIDQDFNALLNDYIRLGKIILSFTIVSIVISVIGLFALTAFLAQQRTKEIGIRKTLGASVGSIAALLSKDFVRLVFIASFIAMPIAWWALNKWLQTFANHINLSWCTLVLAAFITLCITLITVSFQAIKAAIANPVKSLRTE